MQSWTTIIRSLELNFCIHMSSQNPTTTSMHIEKLADEFDSKTAQEVLKWALDTFGTKIALASSFGAEDDVMDAIRVRYGIPIEVYFPDQKEVEEMVRPRGMNLMYESVENRKLCCEIRKVHPLNRALSTLDGWITGLRRDQVVTRATTKKIEIDSGHRGIVKVNPLADWSSDMVWDYIQKNNVPYNKLHDTGFPSIGCEPCTRAIKPGEDPRAGRWWWENAAQKECGLHFDPSKKRHS